MTPTSRSKNGSVQIPISHPGAYLYQAPHQLDLIVDKELAIVFCLKDQTSVGLVLYSPEISVRDLVSELELLHLKIKSKIKIHTTDVSLKLFGLSTGANHVLEAVQSWAKSLNIRIGVIETGKRTIRNLSINCLNGKVGVTYGELLQTNNKLIFLSEGTARTRIPLAKIHNRILILTQNSVYQQLTKAAVEEHPAWAAITVENIGQVIDSSSPLSSDWSVVLCFDDLKNQKGLEKFFLHLRESHPATQIRWVGASLPEFSKNVPDLKLLPPIDYELLPDFKKMLKRAVFDSNLAMNFESVKMPARKRK